MKRHRGPHDMQEADFAARVTRASPVLWTLAAAILARRDDVDDVLQEAAMIAFAKLDRFDPTKSFSAWLASIVRNVARNRARQQRRESSHLDIDALDVAAPPTTPHDEPFEDDLQRALTGLSESQRACFILKCVHDLEYGEIAALLDLPAGTAMSHVHRARARLRERLAPSVAGESRS